MQNDQVTQGKKANYVPDSETLPYTIAIPASLSDDDEIGIM